MEKKNADTSYLWQYLYLKSNRLVQLLVMYLGILQAHIWKERDVLQHCKKKKKMIYGIT